MGFRVERRSHRTVGMLPYYNGAADVPLTDVLVKGTRLRKHWPINRFAADNYGERESGEHNQSVRERQWCNAGVGLMQY